MISESDQTVILEPNSRGDSAAVTLDLMPFFRASKKYAGDLDFAREARIGRGQTCDVVIPDTTRNAFFSREHAVILRQGPGCSPVSAAPGRRRRSRFPVDRFYISDLGSRNGTSLNGERLEPNQWVRIEHGHKVRFGSVDGASREYVFRANVIPLERHTVSPDMEKERAGTASPRIASVNDEDLFGQSMRASDEPQPRESVSSGERKRIFTETSPSVYEKASGEDQIGMEMDFGGIETSSSDGGEAPRKSTNIQPSALFSAASLSTGSLEISTRESSEASEVRRSQVSEEKTSSSMRTENRRVVAPLAVESILKDHQRDVLQSLCTSFAIARDTTGLSLVNTYFALDDIHTSFFPLPTGAGKKFVALLLFHYLAQLGSCAGLLVAPQQKIIHWQRAYHSLAKRMHTEFPADQQLSYKVHAIDVAETRKGEKIVFEPSAPSLRSAKDYLKGITVCPVLILVSYEALTAIAAKDTAVPQKYRNLTRTDLCMKDLFKKIDVLMFDDSAPGGEAARVFDAARMFRRANSRVVLCASLHTSPYYAHLFPPQEAAAGLSEPLQSTQHTQSRVTSMTDKKCIFSNCSTADYRIPVPAQIIIRVHPSDLQEKLIMGILDAFQRASSGRKGTGAHKILNSPFLTLLENLASHTSLFYNIAKDFVLRPAERGEQAKKKAEKAQRPTKTKLPSCFANIQFTKVSSEPCSAQRTATAPPSDPINEPLLEAAARLCPNEAFCDLACNPKFILILNAMRGACLRGRKCILFALHSGALEIFAALLESVELRYFAHGGRSKTAKLCCQEGQQFIRLRESSSTADLYRSIEKFQQSQESMLLLAPLKIARDVRQAHLTGSFDIFIDDPRCAVPVSDDAVRCVSHIGNSASANVYHFVLAKTPEEVRYIPSLHTRVLGLSAPQRDALLWRYVSNAWGGKWVSNQQDDSLFTDKNRVPWATLEQDRHPIVILKKKEELLEGIYRVGGA